MEIDLRTKSYVFAMPCYDGKLCVDTAVGMLQTVSELSVGGVKCQYILNASGSLIDAARNDLVHRFLNTTTDDVLVFIDSDISFDFGAMRQLLALSHLHPIVSGAYPIKSETDKPFLINLTSNKQLDNGLFAIDSIGIGFTAITREALVQMQPVLEKYSIHSSTDVYAYFRLMIENGKYIGEDIYFFNKAREAGLQPMLDPSIELGHVGTKVYNTTFKSILR